MTSWTICLFLFSVWMFFVAGHRNQQRSFTKRLVGIERGLNGRISEIETKVNDLQKNLDGDSSGAKETLLQEILAEFNLRYRQEIIQDLLQEMKTTIATKLVREIVSEVSDGNNKTGEVRSTVDLTRVKAMLRVQKVSIMHLESRMWEIFTQHQVWNRECEKAKVTGRTGMDLCFDKDEDAGCRLKPFVESGTDERVGASSTLAPSARGDHGEVVGGDNGGDSSERPGDGRKQLLVADYFFSFKPLQMLDLMTCKIQPTKNYRHVSSVAFHSKRKRLFHAVNLHGKLSSSFPNGSDVKHYVIGDSIAYKIALDVDKDLLFYVTNIPWSLNMYDLETEHYLQMTSFTHGDKPIGIAVDTVGETVFVLLRLHNGSREITRVYHEQQSVRLSFRMRTVLVDPDIAAIGFGDDRLWYNRGYRLYTMSRADGYTSENFVIRLKGFASDFEIKNGRVYIAYQERQRIDVLEKASRYGHLARLKNVVVRGGHGRSICLIEW